MPKKSKAKDTSLKEVEKHIDKIERSLLKVDARHEWAKSNNMKQYVVTLKDVRYLEQVTVGTASSFTGKLVLTPNGLEYSVTGGSSVNVLPQAQIWNEYAGLYEFYMVEHLRLTYYPAITRIETTTTGIQDTAILPTTSGHIPDSNSVTINFFNPALNLVTAQSQSSNLLARKSGKLHCGQTDKVSVQSAVDNTLLLKQDAPMLRTNQSSAGREIYGDQAGACVIIPARTATTRIPFGYVEFEMRYRFAGRVQPGIAAQPSSKAYSVEELKDMLSKQLMLKEVGEFNPLNTPC